MHLATIDALVADLADGAVVAAMKDTSGAPMALARALIRKGVRISGGAPCRWRAPGPAGPFAPGC